jgi:hypothetical protein
MKNQQEAPSEIRQDTVIASSDTAFKSDSPSTVSNNDTIPVTQPLQQSYTKDSGFVSVPGETIIDTFHIPETNNEVRVFKISQTNNEKKIDIPAPDTTSKTIKKVVINRYNFSDTTDKQFSYAPVQDFIEIKGEEISASEEHIMKDYNFERFQLNWTLIIGLISILLLLSLKRYYQKFISQVVNTLVNYQLAEKMLREKNIIVRRAFFILNLNFILILSLFLLTVTIFYEFRITEKYIYDYLIILGIVAGIIVTRLVSLYITGFLFGTMQAITEHIHISFLVNKNLGLIMLPIVFMILYTSGKISEIAIYLCLGMLVIATFYKIFRGFQIIIRNGVLIFYAFLYLCTLELLPLVLGSKLIISLR